MNPVQEYIYGTFKTEIKNRFLCLVNIDGEDIICYIPSSCRLSNFLDLTDRTVVLKPILTPNSKTKYSVYAVKYGRGFILLNLSQANRIVEEQLHRRYFSFLGKRKKVVHEMMLEGYKSDLYIEDTNTLIEIKSILSFEKQALFPSVYSERAVKQLSTISELLDEGHKACYILVSLNPRVKEIVINPKIEDFYILFSECVKKGMTYCGLSVRLIDGEPELHSKVQLFL